MEPVELTAGDLLLRPWRDDDVPAVWAAHQDPALRLWSNAASASVDDVRALVARRQDWSGGDHASWAVTGDGGAQLLGALSLYDIDRAQGDASVGYWTVPAARGRGVAVRAVVAACAWAFTALPVDRIALFHAAENAASGRVAAKAGFTQEGRLRRSFRYGDGVKHDELLWSRLADDPPPA